MTYRIRIINSGGITIYDDVVENCIDETEALSIFLDNHNIICSGDTIKIDEE